GPAGAHRDGTVVLLRGADTTATGRELTHVLLLATTTGYQIRSFGEAAAALGVPLLFASDRCARREDPWRVGAIPVRFPEEAPSLEAVVSAIAGGRVPPPRGVIAVGDRPTILASSIAAALGLPGNPPAAARRSRNKLESHAALLAAGLPMPAFEAVALE